MSAPLASLFHGDINIEVGADTAAFGYGDINIARRGVINGTENSTSSANGSLIVAGGVGIAQDTFLGQSLNVPSGSSNLTTTHIGTNAGAFTVTGGNALTVSVGAASSITSTGGNLSIVSLNNSTLVQGGLNSLNAISLQATDAAGGVNVQSGAAGQLALTAGSGGIQGVTSSGSLALTANNNSGTISVNSSAGNQNLTLNLSGSTDSQLLLQSSGTNATVSAIKVNTTNTSGNIVVSNSGGTGSGSITNLSGSGGYTVTTNTGGSINLTSQGAGSSIVSNSASAGQNLTVSQSGATDSKLILQSAGTNSTSAILIQTTNTGGSISILEPTGSSGKVTLASGSGGLTASTQQGGQVNVTATGAISNYINSTSGAGQDLNIQVQGATDSKLVLSSSGTSNQAVKILATGSTGGIFASAAGSIQINSSDASNGINIGTLTSVPLKLGTNTSTTTIFGNLDVRGTTTTIESTVVQIGDNIIEVNNAPAGSGNSGVAHNRYQSANNTGAGDVVTDTPESTGTAQAGSTSTITLKAGDTQADDYYAGYWLKITSGTGNNQVRRIKSFNSTTKVATIYTTADQTGVLANPSPAQGLDFGTSPDATSVYALYPCQWIISMWNESAKEYSIVCSPNVHPGSTPTIAHYVDMHIGNLNASTLTVGTINGSVADALSYVTLTDNSTAPVTITGFTNNYGLYLVMVRPTTATDTRCSAIFTIGRLSSVADKGSVVRLIAVKGPSNENIDMQWNANSKPQLFYRPAPGVGGTTQYTVKIVGI